MLEAGAVLQDRYRVEALVGQGGMACVYRATDLERGATVAVKVLHADGQGRFPPGAVAQLRTEARLMSALRHPGLPLVFDYRESPGWSALIMEFVPGRTLDAVLRAEAPLSEARVLRWARQLCDALAYLHAQEPPVIFRDLKTRNLILTQAEQVKLVDFGIAKRLDETLRRSTQTAARGMLSRGFAAVEQYLGGTDVRSDIYALGATLFHLLTGQTPPESMAVARGRVPEPDVRGGRPDLSERTACAIAAMMQVERSRRPPSVAAVREALGFLEAAEEAPDFSEAVPAPGRPPHPAAPPRFEERPAVNSDDPPTERWDPGPT